MIFLFFRGEFFSRDIYFTGTFPPVLATTRNKNKKNRKKIRRTKRERNFGIPELEQIIFFLQFFRFRFVFVVVFFFYNQQNFSRRQGVQ